MREINPESLEPLYEDQRKVFHRKESWQKRIISWVGFFTGIAFTLEFARNYYYLVTSRHATPELVDNVHYDLEFNALLGIIVGILLAIAPIIFAYIMSRRAPKGFAAIKFSGSKFIGWLKAVSAILLSIAIVLLGVFYYLTASNYQWEVNLSGMKLVVLFGSIFLAGPLLAEGIWTWYATKHGIKTVYVLRREKWKQG